MRRGRSGGKGGGNPSQASKQARGGEAVSRGAGEGASERVEEGCEAARDQAPGKNQAQETSRLRPDCTEQATQPQGGARPDQGSVAQGPAGAQAEARVGTGAAVGKVHDSSVQKDATGQGQAGAKGQGRQEAPVLPGVRFQLAVTSSASVTVMTKKR